MLHFDFILFIVVAMVLRRLRIKSNLVLSPKLGGNLVDGLVFLR